MPQAFNQPGAADSHKMIAANKVNCQDVTNIPHFSFHFLFWSYWSR